MGKNDMQTRLDRMRDLLEKGDIDKAQAELERLSQSLDNLTRGMEGDLRGFRRERFTAEDKALAEMEDRVADLAHDEEQLKRDSEEVKARASDKAQQLLKSRAEGLTKKLMDKVVKLRKQVADVELGPLGPWGSDELEKTQKRVDDVARMLEQGDLDEARAMAEEAEGSIGKLIDEIHGEEQASRFGSHAQLARSRGRLEVARPMAHELADEIARALPKGEDLLSPEDRKHLQDLRAQQESVRKRADQLGRDAQKRAREIKDAPLLERLSQEMGDTLHKAGGHMERAEQELKGLQPRNAASEQGQAVERLSQLRQQMQKARRPKDEGAGARLDREPVKIPGADEYRAPKEFRQDILEAAKREAPLEYKEQVKRYYEELIK
jgi:septation ring formation regulator EzrA